jgi:hypothetical protein
MIWIAKSLRAITTTGIFVLMAFLLFVGSFAAKRATAEYLRASSAQSSKETTHAR